ncbi:MAG: hypothetical protein PHE86_03390 [Candidatus Marinimicrobia bacterium]|nr:hypothetical protein [Candidatus Neomarinimicrobiota bacterium]
MSLLKGAVGDWQSVGPIINVKKIFLQDKTIYGSTDGGLLSFDVRDLSTEVLTNIDFLDHIKISSLFLDDHNHLWIGYDHAPATITCKMANGTVQSFSFGFDQILTIAGEENDVIIAYKKGLTYGLAHFNTAADYVAFRDTYENFPEVVDNIYDVAVNDSFILFSSSRNVYAGNRKSSNLKPASQWHKIKEGNASLLFEYNDVLYAARSREIQRFDDSTWVSLSGYQGNTPLRFLVHNNTLMIADRWGMYTLENNQWRLAYSSPQPLNDAIVVGDTLILAEQNKGIHLYNAEKGFSQRILPNSPFSSFYTAVDVDADGNVYFANNHGVSIYRPILGSWHNLIRSDTLTYIHAHESIETFSADTLAYTAIISTSTKIYDIHVANNGYLYATFEGFYIDYPRLNYDPVVKPGPLLVINRNDYSDYTMIDTTNDVFHGSEASVGGESRYLVLRGITETKDGSIWVANAHAANQEPLVRFKPDGSIEKYSVTSSENALEVLPTEMTTDHFDRLWIGLQSHPQNDPITQGGIAVYDYRRDMWYRITSTHGLVNNNVLSIDTAPDGTIWVVTSGGIQSIISPVSVTRFLEDIVSNISSPLPAVSNANITKVRIDSRNNKWLLTSDGGIKVYLFNNLWLNSGYGYTPENSPLLDSFVADAAFDAKTGKAYLATAGGINIVETPWAEEIKGTSAIKVYPQPFNSRIHNRLIIDGLPDQTTVKVVTLGGDVLFTIDPSSPFHYGRQIIWDGRLEDGNPIRRGVYYLFMYNVNGENKTVKFAVQ